MLDPFSSRFQICFVLSKLCSLAVHEAMGKGQLGESVRELTQEPKRKRKNDTALRQKAYKVSYA